MLSPNRGVLLPRRLLLPPLVHHLVGTELAAHGAGAVLRVDPGILAGAVDGIDPVVFSETIRDLEAVTR